MVIGVLMRANQQLAKWIKDSDLTQEDLAEKCGVSQATISQIARGKALPNLRAAVAIFDITGIQPRQWVEDGLEPADDTSDAA